MLTHFIMASSLITLMPGPSMILVIMNTIEGGLRKGFLSILGVVVADAILLAGIVSGVGAIVASSRLLFNSLKLCGALYLMYLGIAIFRTLQTDEKAQSTNLSAPFSSAVTMTLLNPKIIIFLIAFFPQFIDPAQPLYQQLWLLCSLFLVIVFTILAVYSLCSLNLRHALQSKHGSRIIKSITAVSLIACGIIMLR